MKVQITRYDQELLDRSRALLAAADANPESRAILERFDFTDEQRERGRTLITSTERSFEWERAGKAWSFIGLTPERRLEEARHWYRDTRQRYVAECLRRAEEDSGWVGFGSATRWPLSRKLTLGPMIFARHAIQVFSLAALRSHRDELRRNLALANQERPADAPPPKDTALVELASWYERWRLLVQRVFRTRPDLMAPYGLTPGKAPPRLRGEVAERRFGERAAGSLAVKPNGASTGEVGDTNRDHHTTEPAASG